MSQGPVSTTPPSFVPGDVLDLEVGAPAAGGGCVAHAPDGRVVFVRHSLPGERVRAVITGATSSYLRGDAIEVALAAPERVQPPCPHAGPGRCGGCDYQHVDVPAQRALKAILVAEQLRRVARIDREVEVRPVAVPGAPEAADDGLRWRTRLRLAVDRGGRVGYRRHRSHAIERVGRCPIATDAVESTGVFDTLWRGASELDVVTGNGTGTGTAVGAVVSVSRRGRDDVQIPATDAVRAGIVVRGAVERAPGTVEVALQGYGGRHTFRVSPGVFWQAHAGAPETLLGAVLDLAAPVAGARVADLYAGAGLFSVPLATAAGPTGSVVAVERSPRAGADLRYNAATAHLDNVEVLVEEVTPDLVATALGDPDVLVLDPAREGAGIPVMRAIARLARPTGKLRTVVYVACDPASFSRDLRVLLDEGWTMTELLAFDIFPMTEHVELVAALRPPQPAATQA